MVEAYHRATALWWFPVGDDGVEVTTSPDVGIAGDRAQRLEIAPSDTGDPIESIDDRTRPPPASRSGVRCQLTGRVGSRDRSRQRAVTPTTAAISIHEVDSSGRLETTFADTTVSVDKS
ncbi:hypothetical protein [Halostagnicola kamekurae]|uniref:Uncharacterized protein n=1 Tax=Halostagnicola kamekurae TaxID=619731 RepID=A0A1I6TL12_9EURY|nr:hypothetical protein [Halostagnicola kamekurae]SFS89831.1 hypothetical protein SAMN04488556_3195 [Halostagnicola kamekurae]